VPWQSQPLYGQSVIGMLQHFDRAKLADHKVLFRIIHGILIGKKAAR